MPAPPPLSSLGLRAFPPEIRSLIYDFIDDSSLCWTTHPHPHPYHRKTKAQTPALIIALRSDALLYHEVLERFYAQNTFTLHSGNEWDTGDMALTALRSVRILGVEFWSPPSSDTDAEECCSSSSCSVIAPSTQGFAQHPLITANSRCFPDPHAQQHSSSSSIHSLHLDISALSPYDMHACLSHAVTCAQNLPFLRRISVLMPHIAARRADEPVDHAGWIRGLVDAFSRELGTEGRLVRVCGAVGGGRPTEGGRRTRGEEWFWISPVAGWFAKGANGGRA